MLCRDCDYLVLLGMKLHNRITTITLNTSVDFTIRFRDRIVNRDLLSSFFHRSEDGIGNEMSVRIQDMR